MEKVESEGPEREMDWTGPVVKGVARGPGEQAQAARRSGPESPGTRGVPHAGSLKGSPDMEPAKRANPAEDRTVIGQRTANPHWWAQLQQRVVSSGACKQSGVFSATATGECTCS